ncbi:MAG: adenine phosphoribosyltransferase [Qipengyuania citrea]|jgi:adenine phosphoribosyltransferase|uniref:Adenine phosphoribosyltransferase n=1 Tax=Qipengyuania citrea TaxID=225971 RepID=A0A6I4U990_9SPHN|nr:MULTISPECIES: adenine phosphoribosyltransferase [Erythrobacteraceae]MAC30573.1 adenine phosphoribosyltransferase [Erythrobacter sp.]MAL54653.1 adenine phosphoribosyltransferase [Sphingomonadaceae bacterium]MBN90422.1 adenine phosphoribosyltransferase [Erythrobacteraceae bacterium]MCZ4264261.1 adenine phosphoribosyltransferase [Erythrobacter sp. G21629-S1]KZX95223.1 adenine phosphoribosyltransferase [Erythrobacter sp. HI0019]|tara:strand:- start:1336 stop:1866 length:531 start_codon:yes stop_codon:yes gene_type:complete
MTPDEIKALVRTIPDFPKTGIQFRDITTLLGHGRGFAATVEWLTQAVAGAEAIAGMEARGFIFGAAVAARLELPFLPIRKPGKLPCEVIGVEYELEYGLDRLEMDPAAVGAGQHVAIVDDLLATGGTAVAATELLRKAGARVDRAAFVIDLPDLGGNARLASQSLDVRALMAFDGD